MSVETLNTFEYVPSQGKENITTRLVNLSKGMANTIYDWLKRHRGRKELANLDPHILNDVGLTREQVQTEIDKPFWVK